MSLVTEIKDVFGVIKEILTGYKGFRENQRSAIKAVLEAAIATRQYERDVREGRKSIETERSLARIWLAAGMEMQSVDLDMGRRCIIKSDRWSDPEIWDRNKHPGIAIDIDQIIVDCQSILSKLKPL